MKSPASTRDSLSVEPRPTDSPRTRVRLGSMPRLTAPTSQKSDWTGSSADAGRLAPPGSTLDCTMVRLSGKASPANERFRSDETARYPEPRPDVCLQRRRAIPPESARNSGFPLKGERGKGSRLWSVPPPHKPKASHIARLRPKAGECRKDTNDGETKLSIRNALHQRKRPARFGRWRGDRRRFFERGLLRNIRFPMTPPPCLFLDALPSEQRRNASDTFVFHLPFVLEILSNLLQGENIARFQSRLQACPGFGRHIPFASAPRLDFKQGSQTAFPVTLPPTLRLLATVSDRPGGLGETAFLTTLEETKQLDSRRNPSAAMVFFQSREFRKAFLNHLSSTLSILERAW